MNSSPTKRVPKVSTSNSTKTLKARKVVVDSHTGDVCVETRVEAVKRQSSQRHCEVQTINQAQNAKYLFVQKQIEANRRIYKRKNQNVFNEHKQNLKERIALRHVLKEMSQEANSEQDFRRFDNIELKALVEQRIKDCSPTSRRLRACRKMLEDRRPTIVIDKGMSTNELLQAARLRRLQRVQIETNESDDSLKPKVLPPVSTTGIYPEDDQNPTTGIYPEDDQKPTTGIYPEDDQNPTTGIYPEDDQNPTTRIYPEDDHNLSFHKPKVIPKLMPPPDSDLT